MGQSKSIDLSHLIEQDMITYQGLPGPRISDYLTREASQAHYSGGTTFAIGRIDMVANTGTYIDAPFHRYAAGKDLSGFSLDRVADLPGFVIRTDQRPIDVSVFQGYECSRRAVLIQTGWSKHWGSENYFQGHPFLTRDAAQYLVRVKAMLVGIDSYNIDDTADGTRPAHSLLLQAEIPIVEHLCNLQALPDTGFRLFAVPPRIKGLGSFPVRVFALLD
jgi:kynurenine formamidase